MSNTEPSTKPKGTPLSRFWDYLVYDPIAEEAAHLELEEFYGHSNGSKEYRLLGMKFKRGYDFINAISTCCLFTMGFCLFLSFRYKWPLFIILAFIGITLSVIVKKEHPETLEVDELEEIFKEKEINIALSIELWISGLRGNELLISILRIQRNSISMKNKFIVISLAIGGFLAFFNVALIIVNQFSLSQILIVAFINFFLWVTLSTSILIYHRNSVFSQIAIKRLMFWTACHIRQNFFTIMKIAERQNDWTSAIGTVGCFFSSILLIVLYLAGIREGFLDFQSIFHFYILAQVSLIIFSLISLFTARRDYLHYSPKVLSKADQIFDDFMYAVIENNNQVPKKHFLIKKYFG